MIKYVSKKLSNCYVCCLPRQLQAEVKRVVIEQLKAENVSRETLKELTAEAMSSRLCDLTDTIGIRWI